MLYNYRYSYPLTFLALCSQLASYQPSPMQLTIANYMQQ